MKKKLSVELKGTSFEKIFFPFYLFGIKIDPGAVKFSAVLLILLSNK